MLDLLHRSTVSTTDSRPPGPAGIPVVGSLFEARRDPLHFVLNTTRTYGDIVYYRVGLYTGYLVNHPHFVRHVLQMNHRNYSKENYNYEMLKPVIGEGLITSNGDQWRRQRRLIQPAFHRERIVRFGSATTEATLRRLEQWDETVVRGRSIDVATEMMHLTLQIVADALFSIDISADAGTVGSAFTFLNEDISFRLKTVFVLPLWFPSPRNRAFKRARADLDRVVYDIIERRRQSGGSKDDLLAMLLAAGDEGTGGGMTDRQLRDEVMTLLLAGHETTANLLTWTWYLLSTHPTVARILRTELDDVLGGRVPTVDDLPALEYTERVLQESMRLYPPVWIISRTAVDDDEIGGYPIPAGAIVTISPYTMHRHPDFWENPEAFDPDRFLPERAEGRHRYAYFPFGGGPRF